MTATCPSCNLEKSLNQLTHLRKWKLQYPDFFGEEFEDWNSQEEELIRWACDTCLANGTAIMARPDKQNFMGYVPPHLTYFDIDKKCQKCGTKYVYNKEDQRFWFEELGNFNASKSIHCHACRREKRLDGIQNDRNSEQ